MEYETTLRSGDGSRQDKAARERKLADESANEADSKNDIEAREWRPLPGYIMLVLAIGIGVVGGLGAIAFKSVIAFFHNLFFYGRFGLIYDPDAYITPSPLGFFVILVPVFGAVIVTWITNKVAPEARGHGVPEVINAIYHNNGRIRPIVVLAKSVASAISIGTGGSAGREGPIVQVGSAFGSMVGGLARIPVRQRVTLIAAGAAAGIAATFNAPIGGIAFSLELLLVSLSARTVSLVAVASVTATGIGRLYSGLDPSFDVPGIAQFEDHLTSFYVFALCLPFGALVGGAAASFIRGLYWVEDQFDSRFSNPYIRHMSGMLIVGVMMVAFLQVTGHYYIAGVGYPVVLDVLRGLLADPWLLMLLFCAKLLATTLTLGSGASGGVFSPSLFLGATLGAAFGNLVAALLPNANIDPIVFAVAGMAGMVSGTTGAVITAITMTLEQTRDYSAMLPVIATVAIAHMVRVRLVPQSIYTLKLARRGMTVPEGLQAAVSTSQSARTLMSRDYELLDLENLEAWKQNYRPDRGTAHIVVCQDNQVLGIARAELLYLLRDQDPDTVVDDSFFAAAPATTWSVIMRGLRAKGTDISLVFDPVKSRCVQDLVGVITSREIARNARASADLMD